jgi:hypothetical protein
MFGGKLRIGLEGLLDIRCKGSWNNGKAWEELGLKKVAFG